MTTAELVLKEIEEMGEKSFIPVIGPKKGKILDDAVRKAKPKLSQVPKVRLYFVRNLRPALITSSMSE